ncbi:MAG TPA: HAMP domain-containing protein [Bryobacteraceae bacterium]|nr:HAMP domain-containing protein [Bryobacteraceae bacterium]
MNRLRNRLILIFLAATLLPLAATMWFTTKLLEPTGFLRAADEVDRLSKELRRTGRELYQRACIDLKRRVQAGEAEPQKFTAANRAAWPERVKSFADSKEDERFIHAGQDGDRVDYLVRHGEEVWSYSAGLSGIAMDQMSREIADAHDVVDAARERDLRRGFNLTYILLAASFWLVSLALLVYMAHRISRPIQQLTAGLGKLAAGDLNARVEQERDDEIGRAIYAFNHMADRLQESTERLVYLRQLASWQSLARKTAHEVKNSLTPIRLTVEEMLARYDEADRGFMEQATQIVVDEIETLERRIRAFSEFAAEPPVRPGEVDVNSILQERIAFLKTAHPEVAYDCRLGEGVPPVVADQDLIKGILTNLLENAAEAAGDGGRILGVTGEEHGRVAIEVHDSGPGLSEQARASLFQPTISFKKRGMGLGLSIARKSALLSGGDIVMVKGELGGAGFRVLLPVATNGFQARADRG